MKKFACIIIAFMSLNHFAVAQDQYSISRSVYEFYNVLNDRLGNLYFNDHFIQRNFDQLDSTEFGKELLLFYQNSMKKSEIDSDFIKNHVPKNAWGIENFNKAKDGDLVLSKNEKAYEEKFSTLNERFSKSMLSEKRNDTIDNIMYSVLRSSVNKSIEDKRDRVRKKLFTINSVYNSNDLILIVYTITYGLNDSYKNVELLLKQ